MTDIKLIFSYVSSVVWFCWMHLQIVGNFQCRMLLSKISKGMSLAENSHLLTAYSYTTSQTSYSHP